MSNTLSASENLPLFLSVIVLILFSAFFSGSETAFFSLSRSYIDGAEKGQPRKRAVASLLGRPRMLLVTILFGNLLVNIASTSVVTALAINLFGEKGIGIAVIVMTFIILLFGEITPKSLAMKNAAAFAAAAAPLMKIFMILFAPARVVLEKIADFSVERSRRLFGERREEYEAHELATAVEMGHSEGLFDEFEEEVLTKLFLFTETTVREILTPRVEVFSLDVDTPLNEAVFQVRSRGFSRVPLFGETNDNILGVLFAKDLLRYSRDERIDLREIMRPAQFVPDSKRIRELFGELIAARQHMVMVIDEHGSFDGIVTLEDILEEIFGEIRDRREPKVEEFLFINRDSLVAEGAMNLEDINDILGTEFDSREVETVAGYLIEEIGRIPREGEVFTIGDLRFLVISAEPTRINKIKIERVDNIEE